MYRTMRIRVINNDGDQLKISPQIQAALESLSKQTDNSGNNWQEISDKMLRVLEGDNFDITKLQAELKYIDTEKGKEVFSVQINYTA
jgi:hypothetical protein